MNLSTVKIDFTTGKIQCQFPNGQAVNLAVDTKDCSDLMQSIQATLFKLLLQKHASPVIKLRTPVDPEHQVIEPGSNTDHLMAHPLLNQSIATGAPFVKENSKQKQHREALVSHFIRTSNSKVLEPVIAVIVADQVNTTVASIRTQINVCRHLGIIARDHKQGIYLSKEFLEGEL